jgi:hypothetical protein
MEGGNQQRRGIEHRPRRREIGSSVRKSARRKRPSATMTLGLMMSSAGTGNSHVSTSSCSGFRFWGGRRDVGDVDVLAPQVDPSMILSSCPARPTIGILLVLIGSRRSPTNMSPLRIADSKHDLFAAELVQFATSTAGDLALDRQESASAHVRTCRGVDASRGHRPPAPCGIATRPEITPSSAAAQMLSA